MEEMEGKGEREEDEKAIEERWGERAVLECWKQEESGKDLQSFGAYKKFKEEGGGGCLGVGWIKTLVCVSSNGGETQDPNPNSSHQPFDPRFQLSHFWILTSAPPKSGKTS